MAAVDQRPGLQVVLLALTPGSVLPAFEWDGLTTHQLTAVGLQQTVFQTGAGDPHGEG
jgi:hypothetical protein